MATFNKRGYKEPKPKVEKAEPIFEQEALSTVDEKNSTTAGVFNALDDTANKTEAFVEKNQKAIFGVVGAITFIALAYFAYQKFIAEPNEEDAIEQMFVAQQNFKQATDGVKSDSLFNLALNGSDGKFGFVKIASEYSGTKTGNLANYYAGMAFLNSGKYDKAIEYLSDFSSDDKILKPISIGAIGDAHAQKNQLQEALDFYVKAAENNKNDMTTPIYLLKAGKVALALKNKEEALKFFTDIKENYEASTEAQGIDALIGLSQ
ncbi:MAG: hypothetical protein RLZZ312_1675 [Bacteroidota bacterium]|jgi:tetratricopeptide (TPR) repeat protein